VAISKEEVKAHNTADSTWITINDEVFDVSTFADGHPGGEKLLRDFGGKDATMAFNAFHRQEVLDKYKKKLLIGKLEGSKEVAANQTFADISEVPFAEAPYWRGMHSPFHNESHKAFRAEVRAFVATLREEAEESEESGEYPTQDVYKKMGEFGLLACRLAHGPHLNWPKKLPGGVTPETFDYFHESIAHEEVARLSTPGYIDGLGAGYVIGVSPVLVFGPPAMAEKVGKEVVLGQKRICLAISEPAAGSDVAGILTNCVKSADGSKFIVNGVKKWITNGCFADYFVTACKSGDKRGQMTLLLIERSDGVETKKIKTSYAPCAGTAYVMFEDVEVPVDRILGKEHMGFACVMYNFNHERWFIVCQVLAGTRFIVEECWKWASQRMVFGKPLISQPVIRGKLAKMVADVESTTTWLEAITFQMQNMDYAEQQKKLAGPIALLKYQSTRVAHTVSDDACQIFGGRSITKTGMGKYVERFQRTYKFGAILGGSEEIMADLGIKQSLKDFPSNAKL